MDWLDQDLHFKEDRETTHEDDGGISCKVSKHTSNIAQGKAIGSSCKGKAPRIISSSSNSDDGDNRGGINISGVVKIVKMLVRTMEHASLLFVC